MSGADELADFYVHTVQVEPKVGIYGDYGPAVPVPCFVDEQTRIVRAADGTEQTSSTTIVAHPDHAPTLVAGSRVTLPSGDRTTILSRSLADSGPLDLPDHVEAACE
ncbi:hypothetical protein [Serinicoccus sediminis]|uniref:hypothetical protein n=1 Tax=Serinicoccus sediminis TaxID=2306021 RepID=UPI001021A64C|nr:hypothetical protein [Serinicoccus sediminis]